MSDNILQQLQASADLALKSQSVQEGVQHLSRAFTLFSEEANRLKTAYSNLQERFQAVNQELGSKVAELSRLTHYLNNILKNISDAILFIDLEGNITILNDSGQKLLKLKSEQALHKKFWTFFEDEIRCFLVENIGSDHVRRHHVWRKLDAFKSCAQRF